MRYDFLFSKMHPDLEALHRKLTQDLGSLNASEDDPLVRAKRGVEISLEVMKELRDWFDQRSDVSEADEIIFFKYIKPKFACHICFYQQQYSLQLHVPIGEPSVIEAYYRRKLRSIGDYFMEHQDIHNYMSEKEDDYDKYFFLRGAQQHNRSMKYFQPDADPHFCTAVDHVVAELLANDMMVLYLVDRLEELPILQRKDPFTTPSAQNLKWTGPLKGLGQVIRALVRGRAINDGQITISEVARKFELLFGVDLKNIYRATQEDRITKERGAYMKFLWEVLLKDYDEMDQNPR